jgi:hypothetical protein
MFLFKPDDSIPFVVWWPDDLKLPDYAENWFDPNDAWLHPEETAILEVCRGFWGGQWTVDNY